MKKGSIKYLLSIILLAIVVYIGHLTYITLTLSSLMSSSVQDFYNLFEEIDKSKSIDGFWKIEIKNPTDNGDEVGIFYGEIKDTTFVFWHEDINYLMPMKFWIKQDSIYTRTLSFNKKVEKTPAFFGRFFYLEKDSMVILNSREQYYFARTSKSVFKQETGIAWLSDEEK